MFKNYLKIAYRNLIRQKLFSSINIVGLAIGMACAILILLWVQDELGYDSFHENIDNIYRVAENQHYAGREVLPIAVTPGPLKESITEDYPEIEKATRFMVRQYSITYGDNAFREQIAYADPEFLEIFTFPLIKGNPETALNDINAIVLTEDYAHKLFGDEDPMGKTVLLNVSDPLTVTGVMKNPPRNSFISFNCLLNVNHEVEQRDWLRNWRSNGIFTYVQLKEGTDYLALEDKIRGYVKQHNEGSVVELVLEPYKSLYLESVRGGFINKGVRGSMEYVRIFSIIAVFVLLIACINFMNLSTARSVKRSKEVGLRKVVGAARTQLIKQFFVESILLAVIGFLLSLAIVYLLLPAFNSITLKELSITDINAQTMWVLLALVIVTGVVSGSYPALYLSSVKPVSAINANKENPSGGNALFRKALVVIQFALSIILIISTIVVTRQLDFMSNKKLGLDKENVVHFDYTDSFRDKVDVFKNRIDAMPGVISTSTSNNLPTGYGGGTSGVDWEGKNPDETIYFIYCSVDENYADVMNLEMNSGRFYDLSFPSDTATGIVINETAARVMEMEEPVGKQLHLWGDDLKIIGVVKDFHFRNIQYEIEPLVLIYQPSWNNTFFARLAPGDYEETIAGIGSIFKEMAPGAPFDYEFLDENYDLMYRSQTRMQTLFTYFSVLAIIISCLGLFGLASFMAERRTKEIGVRKVLGATVANITFLLSTQFTKWVIVANLIAWPIAYYLMNEWLQEYHYRIDISPWIFPLAGGIALLIALLTVAYQTIKAAVANPVKSLKYE